MSPSDRTRVSEAKPDALASRPLVRALASEPFPDPSTIAQRAYELFEARGRVDGHDLEDWLQAERELMFSRREVEAVHDQASRPVARARARNRTVAES